MDIQNAYHIVVGKLQEWLRMFVAMLPNLIVAVIIVVVAYVAARFVKRIVFNILSRFSHHNEVNQLISQVSFLVVVCVGFFIALGILQLEQAVTSLLAGVGIIGLALGFAFQDIAANFMSGIIIAITHPYKVDDLIESNDYFGVVQKINFRTTDILTFQGQVVLIPNKEVFQKPLKNYSLTGEWRIELKAGVSYGDDLEKVKKVALEAVRDIANRDTDKEPEIFFEEFADSSVNFNLKIWLKTMNQENYWKAKSDVIISIKKAFDKNNISLPFPVRTIDFGVKGGESITDVIASVGDISNLKNNNRQ